MLNRLQDARKVYGGSTVSPIPGYTYTVLDAKKLRSDRMKRLKMSQCGGGGGGGGDDERDLVFEMNGPRGELARTNSKLTGEKQGFWVVSRMLCAFP